MFGSNTPFGQSSTSPFGTQSVFGQNSGASNNPFAPKPFGSTTPFGSQTGSSIFGGTSTGVFGPTQSSSPFSSTTAFGASSSPFSTPAFGASSTPAFGSSSASFGGSSVFGQKPAFGGFGSAAQTTPFGSATQQSQPTFGSSVFGSSSPFGASSQGAFGATSSPGFGTTSTPAFGAASTPAFGATSTPAFGATSTPAFGSTSTPAFGSTGSAFGVSNSPMFGSGGAFGASSSPAFGSPGTPAFGASGTPAFGAPGAPAFGASSTPAFGASGTPAFGASGTPAFGAPGTPAFGASGTPAFGASGTPAFGASSTPAFGASSTPSFSFGSSPAFGQSASAFGSSPFGTATAPYGAQSSPFGTQATTSAFGSSTFVQSAGGTPRVGSRVAPYTPTTETDSSGTQPAGKLESISAMPVYKDKSHEELRWEDYQVGDKGGPLPAGQPAAGVGFGALAPQSSPFASSSTFGQTSANPFSSSTSSNLFASKPPGFGGQGFGSSSTPAFGSSPFGPSSSPNPFSTTSSVFGTTATSVFGSGPSPSVFGSSSSSTFGSSPSIFGSTSQTPSIFGSTSQATTPGFGSSINFGNTQTSPLFPSITPSLGQTGSAFGQSTTPSFGQSTAPSFGQQGGFGSSGFGGSFFASAPSMIPSSSPMGFGQTTPSISTPFQPAQPAPTAGAFGFSNFGQTRAANASGFGGTSNLFGQSNLGQFSATQGSTVMQPAPITNPFGTLPAMPQMSIGQAGAAPSVRYGISTMPVVEKPAPVRISSLLTSRHLSQRRIRWPARKYQSKNDGPKVPFFDDDEETASTPKADAFLIPRENPRALVIRPIDQWPSRSNAEKASPLKDRSTPVHENGKTSGEANIPADGDIEDGIVKEQVYRTVNQKPNGVHDDHSVQKEDAYTTLSGHRAGEAAIVYEHGADIEALMPKLRRSDYYTEPRIQELAAKERAKPGFCRHVKDFAVGRHGYGSIKFLGETDVRRLDLEALIQFNNREVIVYMDESKKPPVGQGLNKPAEITLLNIKCFEKKTGQQYIEGPKIEKYKEMLRRKAEDQGAEFVSYDAKKGEWKFRVNHFSTYKLDDDGDDWCTQTTSVC
ncbi:nuclear pore complex protein NUP98A-like isoform X2 [Tripterygium wilfordii]|uniref:nuclear pore complex protein NUP98A-like isoform X2 n=1 Tax=Tripterygium wilfordii TaxID=458696 RepID=UPI0018F810BF|nr:nuclear pore complex protein NUP98A-like isoform X2 [Tripterygium wilfordii]